VRESEDVPTELDPKALPEAAAARAALGAVLASQAFRDSPQLRAFLTYVVNETLAGRASELKGYSIATLALGRPESFDPQTDPIVRVQAGRLRQALAEYEAEHPDAPLRIRLERGSYGAVFEASAAATAPAAIPPVMREEAPLASPPAAPAATRRLAIAGGLAALAAAGATWMLAGRLQLPKSVPPVQTVAAPAAQARAPETFYPTLSVAIDPASAYSGVSLATTRIRDAISRFDDLIIVGDAADMAGAASSSGGARSGWALTLIIHAAPAGDGTVRLSARLIEDQTRRLLWSREFSPFPEGPSGDAARSGIVRHVASALAQPYGVIHAHVRALLNRSGATDDPYGCIVQGLDYWLSNSRQDHLKARACIIDRLKQYPTLGPLHAQLAYLHLEEFRHGYNPMPGDARARALESAQKAVQDRPASARSQQALMATLYASGDLDNAWRAGADALALNPYDTEIIADVGSYHVMAGNFERGLGYLDQAIEFNPAPPAWVVTFRAMALYMLGRLDQSGPMVRALQGSDYPPAQMALVMAAYQFRDIESGKRHLASFRSAHPEIASDPPVLLRRMNFQEATLSLVMRDFNAAVSWITSQQ
jgi:tetratricopeptide (TPR) repeat protein